MTAMQSQLYSRPKALIAEDETHLAEALRLDLARSIRHISC